MYSLLLVLLKPQEHFKKIDNLKKYFFFSEFYCESRSLTSRLNFASHAVGFLYYCNLQWINITLDHWKNGKFLLLTIWWDYILHKIGKFIGGVCFYKTGHFSVPLNRILSFFPRRQDVMEEKWWEPLCQNVFDIQIAREHFTEISELFSSKSNCCGMAKRRLIPCFLSTLLLTFPIVDIEWHLDLTEAV